MANNSLSLFLKQEQLKKRRRIVFRISSLLSILLGWSVPLLVIIDLIPNNLWLLFLGTGLIWFGFIVQLLISSGEI